MSEVIWDEPTTARPADDTPPTVTYQPILDVARGVAAGYQAQPAADELLSAHSDNRTDARAAEIVRVALAAIPSLPVNTFVSVPVVVSPTLSPHVRRVLLGRESLQGVVIDIVGRIAGLDAELDDLIEAFRASGALIAVGGNGAPQPELTGIVRLKPDIVRLGRDWVRGIDTSESKRDAIDVIGRLTSQLDAWVLAEGVATAAELRELAALNVPLAQGPFIATPRTVWPEIDLSARSALPTVAATSDGVLRQLLQQAYTARDADESVLPDSTGLDVVIVLDEFQRPQRVLEHTARGWESFDVLAVNIDTAVTDAVQRAIARPRATRFSPLAATDNAGRFLGILRLERLVGHLAGR